jgi:hypothetical protein
VVSIIKDVETLRHFGQGKPSPISSGAACGLLRGSRKPSPIRYGASEPIKELLQSHVKGLGDLLKRPDTDFLVPVLQLR